jgi:hypothetical protein
MALGLGITFGSIAYYPVLLAHWRFGLFDVVRWAEPFIEVFGGSLVLLGILVRFHSRRMKVAGTVAGILILVAAGTYVYDHLSDTGQIAAWLERNTESDTVGGLISQQTPSLVQTLRSFESYLQSDEHPNNSQTRLSETISPAIASGESINTTNKDSTPSKFETNSVRIDGAYLVGAKGNRITLINNSDAKDPSWNELIRFLKDDPTDKMKYASSSFVCADFAEMLHNNAEKAGYRAAYGAIRLGPVPYWPTQGGHTFDAFQTTDRGLVFIDATGTSSEGGPSERDKIVAVEVGKNYVPRAVFPEEGWSNIWDNMGEVLSIETIQW